MSEPNRDQHANAPEKPRLSRMNGRIAAAFLALLCVIGLGTLPVARHSLVRHLRGLKMRAVHASGHGILEPPNDGTISIAITHPVYGFNVLPGSVRRIYATVKNGKTNGVSWTVSDGAKLSATTGNWVDVTAPGKGSSCGIQGNEKYTVTSGTHFTITAKSKDSASATSSIQVNVCNPAVQVHVVPFYTTLYSGQKADIQAFIWGSVNLNVNWSITGMPRGGDGTLTDNVNMDTVFSATVAGRYTLTATSVADGTKSNTATIFVTGHPMPYAVTQSKTMPVDCTVDPALKGRTFEVGPNQQFKTIQSVPWNALKEGSTIRIHNEDTTGANPTTYHEYFQLSARGKRDQPIRVCGVPDARGNLPVLDAISASGRAETSRYSAGYAVVGIGATGWAGVYAGPWFGPQYLIVEGLKIQNSRPIYKYTLPGGGSARWVDGTAGLRIFRSMDTVVRGLDIYNCSDGIFSDFNSNSGFSLVENTLYEGNHLHKNGEAKSWSFHQFYIQGWNEVIQFNILDEFQKDSVGANFKSRGFPDILRYNHFGDGALREIDLVDMEDAGNYSMFEGYLWGGKNSYKSLYPKDAYTADLLAAAVEAHHADYVYGNTFTNTMAAVPIHYSTDHGSYEDDRIGTLWFYNNSFHEGTPPYESWDLFDTSAGGGLQDAPEIEWPQIQVHNNAIWMDSPLSHWFCWNNRTSQFTIFGKNVINANWGNGDWEGGKRTGWASRPAEYGFQGASIQADTSGAANIIGASSPPFDKNTFAPEKVLINAGASLPANAPKMPVRFQYGPKGIQVMRKHPLTIGAME
jgi:hypothetical protein